MMKVLLDEYMGDDLTIARKAWVSTQTDERDASPEAVEKLIRFLLSNTPTHASPFGHPHITFLVEAPIFVAREWMRHRVQIFSEVSTRYSDMSGETYLPPVEDFRTQIGKPGAYRMEAIAPEYAVALQRMMSNSYEWSFEAYRKLTDMGVAREVARNVLPLGTMTRFYATASLRNWLGFLILRNHPSALLEIRRCAEKIETHLEKLFPITMQIWNECGRPQL